MKLRDIARLCGASHLLDEQRAEAEPAGFTIDSRAVRAGEVFVAFPGARADGHDFVRQALDNGALAALVVHHRLPFATELGDLAGRLLFVEDTRCAFQQLAQRVIANWHRPVVGVTASAGKTTIKDLTAHVLGAAGNVLKSHGNLNTGYGLALTVTRMIAAGARPSDFDFAVLEMGMSSYGEIARLVDLAPPAIGVIGNVGTAHLEFFGSRQRLARAKAEMADGVKPGGTLVLNADDPLVMAMRNRRPDLAFVSFGLDASADVAARDLRTAADLGGAQFVLVTPDGEADATLPLIGRHNVYNALAAAAVAHTLGIGPDRIAERLATAAPSRMRGELIRFDNGVTVIDDTYNSNPQALLESVRAMPVSDRFARRIVVAGEMLELGAAAEELHRACGREIASMNVDRLIGVRGLAAAMVESAAGSIAAAFCETPEDAASLLLAELRTGDLVLVKGSRGVRTERIVERLCAEFGGR
jgi:UDP-N-acetylmuramoyl-tripeptide--D-alanyl-D-alanine ligase